MFTSIINFNNYRFDFPTGSYVVFNKLILFIYPSIYVIWAQFIQFENVFPHKNTTWQSIFSKHSSPAPKTLISVALQCLNKLNDFIRKQVFGMIKIKFTLQCKALTEIV